MNGQEAISGQAIPIDVKKRIVPFDEDNPSIEPLFINCTQPSQLGEDIFLDVGVITLESLDRKMEDGSPAEFAVISRLAMSRLTATTMRDQLDNLLKRNVGAIKAVPNAGS